MKRMECPACVSLLGNEQYEVNGFSIWKCSKCGTLYVRDVPGKSELDKIYEGEEYYDLDDQAIDRIHRDHCRRLENIKRFTKTKNVLDVGCTTGLFLDKAANAGYETYGIELSEKNAVIAREKGHHVFLGPLDEYVKKHSQEKFEFISCLDVIEHIEYPLEFMKQLSLCLAPRGVLLMSTPNYSGLVSKVLGKRDVFLTPPEHLNFFTKQGLLTLAKSSGFISVHQCTFGSLTKNESDRAVIKYFPKAFHPTAPLLSGGIKMACQVLNIFKKGLETEIYFTNLVSK